MKWLNIFDIWNIKSSVNPNKIQASYGKIKNANEVLAESIGRKSCPQFYDRNASAI